MITYCCFQELAKGFAAPEQELAEKVARFIKAELKRANVTYEDLAFRLEAHGLRETKASIANKLSRGTIGAALLLTSLAALGMEGVRLEDL